MSFWLSLYRAPNGLSPIHEWDKEQRQALGTRGDVQASLDRLFQPIRWELSDTLAWACYPNDDSTHPREITLHGKPEDALLEISIYSGPPAIRTVMTALALNYCYAQESGKLYFPFATGDDWSPHSSR